VYGLDAALAGLCQDFQAHTPLNITYKGDELPDLSALTALSLYRFAQEALTNVVKHAAATEVEVTLTPDLDMIALVITDNGRGFSPPQLEENLFTQGIGLAGMVERLEVVDGHVEIESTPGKGSRLTAVVPNTSEIKKEEQ
jgi:signal transduction histidine kinase